MNRKPLPEFEMRHRMALALEYGSVSVNDIARELGISRTTVSNYLHGRTRPRRGDLIAWAFKCGVPFDWIVGEDSSFELDVASEDVALEPLVKPHKPKAVKAPAVKTTGRKPAAKAL